MSPSLADGHRIIKIRLNNFCIYSSVHCSLFYMSSGFIIYIWCLIHGECYLILSMVDQIWGKLSFFMVSPVCDTWSIICCQHVIIQFNLSMDHCSLWYINPAIIVRNPVVVFDFNPLTSENRKVSEGNCLIRNPKGNQNGLHKLKLLKWPGW